MAEATSTHSQLPAQAALASSKAVRTALNESSISLNLNSSQSQTQANHIPTQTSASASSSSSPISSPQPINSSSTEEERDEDDSDDSQLEEGQIKSEPAGVVSNPVHHAHNNNLITVFSSQTDFNVKHPLYSTWTLWFDNASKNDKAKNWDELIQRVMEVESVEEFWGLYHNIVPPSLIHVGSNYYLFKEGIKPAWEDASNHKGGRWSIQLSRERNKDTIDKWWLYTMLAAIGETFETPYTSNGTPAPEMSFTNEVTGVIVSSRKAFYRISIWTRSADSRPIAENIGRHFKYGVLGMSENNANNKKTPGDSNNRGVQTDCEFQSHSDSQKKKRGGWTV